MNKDFPGGSEGKASAYNAGDLGSIFGLGRSPGEGNGNPLQHSCLENSTGRGTWWATVQGASRNRTRLSDFTFTITLMNKQEFTKYRIRTQRSFTWLELGLWTGGGAR